MSLSIPSTTLAQRYLKPLLEGDRAECRKVIETAFFEGASAYEMITGTLWPVMELIQSHYREDRITHSTLNLATRLNRSITDQVSARLERRPANGRKTLIFCGADEPEELGGQITSDLFEADGWMTKFAGGGVPDDEVLKLIGEFRPNLLVMCGTLPSGVPSVRKLIDYLREVNSCPDMQIMCCGGIYKRAEGLSEEIGADLYAPDGAHAVQVANANPSRKATVDQQTVGRTRRIRKAAARKAASAQRQMVRTQPDEEAA
jgi:methanogenic corrinoid protein MtbC1